MWGCHPHPRAYTTAARLQTQLKEKLKLSVEDIPMLDSQRIRRPDRTRRRAVEARQLAVGERQRNPRTTTAP